MSVLNREFLKFIARPLEKPLTTFRDYDAYLRSSRIHRLLDAELLSHIVDYDSNEDASCFLMYKYEDKYILIHIFVGTCSGCGAGRGSFEDVILVALDKAYVSTHLQEVEAYYLRKLSSDCNFANVYAIHPDRPDIN